MRKKYVEKLFHLQSTSIKRGGMGSVNPPINELNLTESDKAAISKAASGIRKEKKEKSFKNEINKKDDVSDSNNEENTNKTDEVKLFFKKMHIFP